MRVALTGADGFTGRYVRAALEARGATCVPLAVDLTDAAAVEAAVAELRFDRLIHLAAKAFVNAADWRGFYEVNQIATFALLDALSRARPGMRCVLASSAQVYGPGAEGLLDEDAPARPANHYGLSKWAMEQGAALWRDRLEIVVTRPFNYTGIGQSADYLIPKIVDHFRKEAATIELGNMHVRRDFGDVRSVSEVYAELALTERPPAVVNIGTGALHSIGDILAALTAISGHAMEVRVNPALVRANDVPTLGCDTTRLRAALPRWSPRPLADTLGWMYGAADERAHG